MSTFNETLSSSGLVTNNNGSTDPAFATGAGGVQLGDSVSVAYTYTPVAVPEPTSLTVIGIPTAGLLLRRRRNRASATRRTRPLVAALHQI